MILSPLKQLLLPAAGLLLLALCFLLLPAIRARQTADAQWAELRERQTLRLAIDPGWQPFTYYDAAGWQGLDADLAREIARRLGVQLQTEPVGYDALYDALALKRADAAMSAVVADPNRLADVVYTAAYFDAGARLVSRAIDPIDRPDQLAGRRVAVALGSEADRVARYWERRVADMRRMALADDADAFQALQSGRADAAILDALAAERLASSETYRAVSLEPRLYHIAVRRDNTWLLNELNRAIDDMRRDGSLERLVDRWLRGSESGTRRTGRCSANGPPNAGPPWAASSPSVAPAW